MDPTLFLIILIPVAISLVAKFALKWDISWLEFGVQVVIGVLALSLIWFAGRYSAASDVEFLNGQVTGKYQDTFPCPTNTSNPCHNGYTCNIRQVCTGTGKDRTCRTESDTCYRYSWERDWYVKTSVHRGGVEISRVDAQGARTPARWESAQPGDPATVRHSYKNWVKAATNSLFNENKQADEIYAKRMPEKQPMEVFDYYRVDRVHTPGWRFAHEDSWNQDISKALINLGPMKQMNIHLVIVRNVNPDYAHALRRQWQGFKKNDSVIFIGIDNHGVIQWADTMSWSRNDIFNVKTRGYFNDRRGQNINDLNSSLVMQDVKQISLQHFERRSMKEFEYLKGSIPPPTWMVVLSVIAAILLGVGTSYLFNNIELGEQNWQNRRTRW